MLPVCGSTFDLSLYATNAASEAMMIWAKLAHTMAITSRMAAARSGGGQRDEQQ